MINKAVVIEHPHFTAYLEQSGDYTFLHCDVTRYNKAVKRDLLRGLHLLLSMRKSPLFALHEQGDTKHHKFLTMLGFEFLTATTDCPDEETRDIYIID
jgi:hypothetical protein